jgi:hypothetical protein
LTHIDNSIGFQTSTGTKVHQGFSVPLATNGVPELLAARQALANPTRQVPPSMDARHANSTEPQDGSARGLLALDWLTPE